MPVWHRVLTCSFLAGEREVIVAGNVVPFAFLVPDHHNAVLARRKEVIGLVGPPVLVLLPREDSPSSQVGPWSLLLPPSPSPHLSHTSPQQSPWVASTAPTSVISVVMLPGTRPAFLEAWKNQSLGLPPLNAQPKHSTCEPWGPSQPKSWCLLVLWAPGSPGSARQTSGSRSPQLCH